MNHDPVLETAVHALALLLLCVGLAGATCGVLVLVHAMFQDLE